MNRDEKGNRYGYDNPCDDKDCIVCRIKGQVHIDTDEEIMIADIFNKNLKKQFQEDNK
jgi:hypothetical protein